MALINCPECGKEVSDTSYKCPNCGFIINEPKRTFTGQVFQLLFTSLNLIMVLIFLSMFFGLAGSDESSPLAGVMGTIVLIIIWVLLGLPLGIMSYITRAKVGN